MQNITSTITKVIDLASGVPEKKNTLVNTHPNQNENVSESRDEMVQRKTRAKYLLTKIEERTRRKYAEHGHTN